MKNGKFSRKAKRKFRKRIVAVLVSVSLICALAIGATMAFLSATTTDIVNIFNPSQVTSKVVETFDGEKKSNVKIQNTGDISAYIRADIVVTWMDPSGNVLGEVPKLGTDYTWTLNTGAAGSGKWFEKEDGFYYWPKEVSAYDDETTKTDKDLTDALITTATALTTKTVGDTTYYVSIEILSSAIQSVPEKVVEDMWKVTVTDGIITG